MSPLADSLLLISRFLIVSLVKPAYSIFTVDFSAVWHGLDNLTKMVIAEKHCIDMELAPFIDTYDNDIYNSFDTLCNRIDFVFPEKKCEYYIDKLSIQPKIAHQVSKNMYYNRIGVYFHSTDEDQKRYREILNELSEYDQRAFVCKKRSLNDY